MIIVIKYAYGDVANTQERKRVKFFTIFLLYTRLKIKLLKTSLAVYWRYFVIILLPSETMLGQ